MKSLVMKMLYSVRAEATCLQAVDDDCAAEAEVEASARKAGAIVERRDSYEGCQDSINAKSCTSSRIRAAQSKAGQKQQYEQPFLQAWNMLPQCSRLCFGEDKSLSSWL